MSGLSVLRQLARLSSRAMHPALRPRPAALQCRQLSTEPPEHHPPSQEPWIPEYMEKFEEPLEDKRNRLVYQSRKRGMLENGLLLGK